MCIKCTKWIKSVYILAAVFLISLVWAYVIPCKAETATGYERIWAGHEKPEKSAGYYFKMKYFQNGEAKVYMSKKEKNGYKETPLDIEFYSNGHEAYYVKRRLDETNFDIRKSEICRYNFETGSNESVKTLPSSSISVNWSICSVYDGRIYLQHSKSKSRELSELDVYVYDIKRKKLSKIKDDYLIADMDGKYMAGIQSRTYCESAYGPAVLYQAASSGLKKVRTLTKEGDINGIQFVGENLFYTSRSDNKDYTFKMTLYQCSQNGTERRKLGTFKNTWAYSWNYNNGITSKYCTLFDDKYLYKYYYASKKLKKIGPAPSMGIG